MPEPELVLELAKEILVQVESIQEDIAEIIVIMDRIIESISQRHPSALRIRGCEPTNSSDA